MIKITNQINNGYKKINIGDKIRIKKYRKAHGKQIYIGMKGKIVDSYYKRFNDELVYVTNIDKKYYYWFREEIQILK